uniref:uncharacterized protein LOC132687243 n=1 Tax=Panthera onca TaxID=9690 RepID=UPI002954CFD8|nr:uncharacterized protein LOC132687243 [Panthera onca]XP_060501211.1 uncharacterized protein LOC132687243 [Panthera onca]XP_060501212.1 uncharacterized protein LOC132687243 [Panthera onca]
MCHTASGDNSREPRALCSICRKTKFTLRPKLGSVKTTNTAHLMKVLHSGLRRAWHLAQPTLHSARGSPPPPPAESPHRHPVPPHVFDSPTFSRPSPVFRGFDLVRSPASGSLPLPASNEEPSSPPVLLPAAHDSQPGVRGQEPRQQTRALLLRSPCTSVAPKQAKYRVLPNLSSREHTARTFPSSRPAPPRLGPNVPLASLRSCPRVSGHCGLREKSRAASCWPPTPPSASASPPASPWVPSAPASLSSPRPAHKSGRLPSPPRAGPPLPLAQTPLFKPLSPSFLTVADARTGCHLIHPSEGHGCMIDSDIHSSPTASAVHLKTFSRGHLGGSVA